MSLRTRQILLAVFTSLLPLIILGAVSVWYTKAALEHEIVNTMTLTTNTLREDIDTKIVDRVNFLKSLAELEVMQSMEPQAMNRAIKPFATTFPDMDGIVVIDLTGLQIARANKGGMVNVKDRDYFRAVVDDKKDLSIGAPSISKVTNRPIIGIAVPVKRGQNVIGVVAGYLQVDTTLGGSIHRVTAGEAMQGRRIMIVDKTNTPLYHPDKEVVAAGKPLDIQALQQRGHTVYQEADGKTHVASITQSKLSQWIVFSDVLEDDAFAPVKKLQAILFILTGILLVLSLVATRLMVNKIVNPLKLIGEKVENIAEGNFQIDIEEKHFDTEVQVLVNAFNRMKDNVKAMIGTIASTADQVAAASEELTAGAEQSAMAASQVAASVTTVAEGAERQEQLTRSTVTIAGTMSANIRKVLDTAESVSRQSEKAAQAAQAGGESASGAVRKMAEIERSVTGSAAVVAKLGERSQEIGQIVETIASIAGQTNLLALNAAIEAARAGEQGRGFAVVAEEVRKLAEQSQEAAKQIADLIGSIQTETGAAVSVMAAGSREVKAGADVVNAAGEAFQDIITLVSSLANQVAGISTAIRQLDADSGEITAATQNVEALTKSAVAETQTVSAATEEQSASLEEIADSSQNLSTLAQNLQDAISKFRI